MAITSAVCNQYKISAMKGIHRSGDTYKIALFTSTATLDKTTTAYSATNEVANGNGYTTGGATLGTFSATLAGDVGQLDFADASWAASTITARGALIYNTTSATNGGAANEAVAVVNFGSDIVSTGAAFTVTIANAVTLS